MRTATALGCSLAVVFLLRVLAAFVADYWRTKGASGFMRPEIRFSNRKQLATMKNTVQGKGSTDASEKIAMGMTLGTVLTLPVYAKWETIQAASPLDRTRKLKVRNR